MAVVGQEDLEEDTCYLGCDGGEFFQSDWVIFVGWLRCKVPGCLVQNSNLEHKSVVEEFQVSEFC